MGVPVHQELNTSTKNVFILDCHVCKVSVKRKSSNNIIFE